MSLPGGSATQEQIEGLHRADTDFFRALIAADIPAIESLLAEEFLIVDVASGSCTAAERSCWPWPAAR